MWQEVSHGDSAHQSQQWPEEVVEVGVPSVHPERNREAPRKSAPARACKLPWLGTRTTTIHQNQARHSGTATLADYVVIVLSSKSRSLSQIVKH